MKHVLKHIVFFFLFANICSCTQENETKKNKIEIAKEIIEASKNCALITVDSLGIAHVRTMDPFLPEEDFTIWMATNSESSKVNEIRRNSKVTLYYFDKENPGYVTLEGTAMLIDTPKTKEQYWKDEWKNFYNEQKTNYLLIKFIPSKLYLISEKYNILGDSLTWKSPEITF